MLKRKPEQMKHLSTKALIVADAIGATDPDVAWLYPAWVYKALLFAGLI